MKGNINKMKVQLADPVQYQLEVGSEIVNISELLGLEVAIEYDGKINCIACNRKTNKSFGQGYCFPCFRSLARCDMCIMKPETCHFESGTCREPDWAEDNCMQPHFVYLANSSGVKVGITRASQIPTRWIDQGASQALPIFSVATRKQSGLIEVLLKAHVSDRTDWRKMLKGEPDSIDLHAVRDKLFDICRDDLSLLQEQFGDSQIKSLDSEDTVQITYPVREYPEKVKSLNLDKTPSISGRLMGIKGQYLIFDVGVLNIRKFSGYDISLRVE